MFRNEFKWWVQQSHPLHGETHKEQEACPVECLHMQHKGPHHPQQMRVQPLLCPSQHQHCLLCAHTVHPFSLGHAPCSIGSVVGQSTVLSHSNQSTTHTFCSFHLHSDLCQREQLQCKYPSIVVLWLQYFMFHKVTLFFWKRCVSYNCTISSTICFWCNF